MFLYIRNVMNRRREDEGASAVEYGLLVAAIAAVVILLVFAIGSYVKDAFQTTCEAFEGRAGATGEDCTPA
jgi:pilus assembly protein Flp/PilA